MVASEAVTLVVMVYKMKTIDLLHQRQFECDLRSCLKSEYFYKLQNSKSEISDHSEIANNWHSEDVEAEILSSHDDAEYRGKICVIKTVHRYVCSVWIISANQTIYVQRKDLKPVKPRKNHKVAKTLITF